jgi:long-subunit fatty acid transport protein
LGDGDRLRRQQKNIAWSGMAGISARLFQNVTLAAQIDAHTAIYDSKEAFLGDAIMLTLGGTYRLTENWKLSFGVTEDIGVESTSDVAFLFQVKARR